MYYFVHVAKLILKRKIKMILYVKFLLHFWQLEQFFLLLFLHIILTYWLGLLILLVYGHERCTFNSYDEYELLKNHIIF